MKVAGLLVPHTGRLNPQGKTPGTYFNYYLSGPQDHGAASRMKSMKNFRDAIGNETRDLEAFSAVPKRRYRVLPVKYVVK